MKPWQLLVLLIPALVFASPATGSAQILLRPGQYELTLEMNVAGVSRDEQQAVMSAAGFKNDKRLECKTAAEVGDANTMAKFFVLEAEELNCKMSDLKTTGNKMTFTTICEEDGIRLISNFEMTFGLDSVAGFITTKDSLGRTSTIKSTSKRVGECKK